MKENQKFIMCNCQSEGLLLTVLEKEVYLSVYTFGQFQKKPSFWNRLKYCWYHLRTGKKYEDQVIIDFETTDEIAKWLLNKIE